MDVELQSFFPVRLPYLPQLCLTEEETVMGPGLGIRSKRSQESPSVGVQNQGKEIPFSVGLVYRQDLQTQDLGVATSATWTVEQRKPKCSQKKGKKERMKNERETSDNIPRSFLKLGYLWGFRETLLYLIIDPFLLKLAQFGFYYRFVITDYIYSTTNLA